LPRFLKNFLDINNSGHGVYTKTIRQLGLVVYERIVSKLLIMFNMFTPCCATKTMYYYSQDSLQRLHTLHQTSLPTCRILLINLLNLQIVNPYNHIYCSADSDNVLTFPRPHIFTYSRCGV
jgi:hypothetical protein